MKRRLSIRKLLLFLFLLLPLLTAAAWVRSQFVEDDLQLLRAIHDIDGGDNSNQYDEETGYLLPYQPLFDTRNQYFTLASHRGSLALALFKTSDVMNPKPRTSLVDHFFCWRNSSDQPILDGLGYPLFDYVENPLFEPNERFENEIYRRGLFIPRDIHFWNKLGFLYDNGWYDSGRMWTMRIWYCPWWLVTVLSLLPLSPYFARKLCCRRLDGLCPACSYDLRAHALGEKCPECGTLIVFMS